MFVAERNISVFGRMERVARRQIVIGGERPDAIPEEDFRLLLKRFPTSTECRLYSDARVGRVIQEYYASAGEAERKLQKHLDAKRSARSSGKRAPYVISEMELDKFTFVRDRLSEMLGDAESYSEREWQTEVAETRNDVILEPLDVGHRDDAVGVRSEGRIRHAAQVVVQGRALVGENDAGHIEAVPTEDAAHAVGDEVPDGVRGEEPVVVLLRTRARLGVAEPGVRGEGDPAERYIDRHLILKVVDAGPVAVVLHLQPLGRMCDVN